MTFTTIFKGDSILLLPLIVAWPTIFGVFGVPLLYLTMHDIFGRKLETYMKQLKK
jgi:asparagine N-glycosylation enzyme membrane subunit Stt3